MPTNDPTAPRVVGGGERCEIHGLPLPPGRWAHCTPALLATGVDCALSARRAGPNGIGHEHFLAASPEGGAPTEEPTLEGIAAAIDKAAAPLGPMNHAKAVWLARHSVVCQAVAHVARLTRSPRAAGEPSDTEREALARSAYEEGWSDGLHVGLDRMASGPAYRAACDADAENDWLNSEVRRTHFPPAPPPERAP